jgi:hypothetical protein
MRNLLVERKKKLNAALHRLEQQRAILEKDIEERKRLCRELKALVSKYWPDKPRHRPPIWKGQDGCDLVVLVEGMREQTGCSAKDAIERLRKIKRLPFDHPVDQLVVRYSEAKKTLVASNPTDRKN